MLRLFSTFITWRNTPMFLRILYTEFNILYIECQAPILGAFIAYSVGFVVSFASSVIKSARRKKADIVR